MRCIALRLLLVLAGAASASCDRPVTAAEVPARLAALQRPHLILVICDTLRADWLTPYGFERDTSPELTRWAQRGVVFEHVLAQSSWTKISMASLMTSLWPRTHGISESDDGLAASALTLAEVLQDGGYTTHAIQTNGWLDQSFGFHQGYDRYVFPRGGSPHMLFASVWPHADRVLEEAARLIEGHDRARPLFLYLHFMDVHEYAAPPEFQAFGTDARGVYLAAIRWVDDALRRLREKLEHEGLLDDTVIVFGSDHGETFGENGVHGHARNVLTPVLRVPLVIRLPFAAEPIRVSGQVRNIDVAPTIVEIAGLPAPASFEGRSLLPLLDQSRKPDDRISFARLAVPLFFDASVQDSINAGDWSYARNATLVDGGPAHMARGVAPGAEFLFDRRVDPEENVNLVGREAAEAERLRGQLAEQIERPAEEGVRSRDVRIDPAIAERLRAMGYLQDPQ